MTSPYKKTSHVVIINFGINFVSVCNKRCKETEINGNIGNTKQQKPTEGNGRNRDSQRNGNEETESHDMVLKLQISCNKKEIRFYSKSEIFGKL